MTMTVETMGNHGGVADVPGSDLGDFRRRRAVTSGWTQAAPKGT